MARPPVLPSPCVCCAQQSGTCVRRSVARGTAGARSPWGPGSANVLVRQRVGAAGCRTGGQPFVGADLARVRALSELAEVRRSELATTCRTACDGLGAPTSLGAGGRPAARRRSPSTTAATASLAAFSRGLRQLVGARRLVARQTRAVVVDRDDDVLDARHDRLLLEGAFLLLQVVRHRRRLVARAGHRLRLGVLRAVHRLRVLDLLGEVRLGQLRRPCRGPRPTRSAAATRSASGTASPSRRCCRGCSRSSCRASTRRRTCPPCPTCALRDQFLQRLRREHLAGLAAASRTPPPSPSAAALTSRTPTPRRVLLRPPSPESEPESEEQPEATSITGTAAAQTRMRVSRWLAVRVGAWFLHS